jgi:hypothetical protein
MSMGMAGMGVDLTQAAYRYNHNMMEYYTCKKLFFTTCWSTTLVK